MLAVPIHTTLYSASDLPFWLSVDLVTEGHDELPVLIAILGIGGLLCGAQWRCKHACATKYTKSSTTS